MKNKANINVRQVKILYVGTNEQVAKLAPIKGLMPSNYLTDIYPGFFCKQNSQEGRWGIISVNVEKLYTDKFAPSPSYIDRLSRKKIGSTEQRYQAILAKIQDHKSKWQKSLENSGICLYTSYIPPPAIEKVMIYNPSSNTAISDLLNELPSPFEISSAERKAVHQKAFGILKWLNGEEINCHDVFNGMNLKRLNEIEDKLHNRSGLDVYYVKPEEKIRKSAAKKMKE